MVRHYFFAKMTISGLNRAIVLQQTAISEVEYNAKHLIAII